MTSASTNSAILYFHKEVRLELTRIASPVWLDVSIFFTIDFFTKLKSTYELSSRISKTVQNKKALPGIIVRVRLQVYRFFNFYRLTFIPTLYTHK